MVQTAESTENTQEQVAGRLISVDQLASVSMLTLYPIQHTSYNTVTIERLGMFHVRLSK